jgi:hypothetical protein
MTADEYSAFRADLLAAAGILGRRLPEDVAKAYFRALDDLPAPAVAAALRDYVRGVESGGRFLTPVELRRHVESRLRSRAPGGPRAPSPPEGPPVTRAGMAAILRDVAPRAAPRLRQAWLELAEKLERGVRVAPETLAASGPLGAVIARQLGAAREPGEEG